MATLLTIMAQTLPIKLDSLKLQKKSSSTNSDLFGATASTSKSKRSQLLANNQTFLVKTLEHLLRSIAWGEGVGEGNPLGVSPLITVGELKPEKGYYFEESFFTRVIELYDTRISR